MDKVAVILVLYNNRKYIKGCIDSIMSQTYRSIEIVAVNNASQDDSSDFIRNNYPNTKVIDLDENIGFAGGCNEGIKYALDNGANYCLLLNVDTVADRDMIMRLVSSSKGEYVVSPYIYYSYDRKYRIYDTQDCATWYAGGSIDKYTVEARQNIYEGYVTGNLYDVEFISGCCMLIPSLHLKKTGMMSTEYFMYYEDVDYCFRLLKNGVLLKYVPDAILWHAETGSQENQNMCNHDYYCMRNKLYIMEKYPELFNISLLQVLKNNFIKLKSCETECENEYIEAQIEGINDFLKGKVGKKIWQT